MKVTGLSLLLLSTIASAHEIVTFNSTRGGMSSLSDAAGFSQFRSALALNLPSYSIRSTSELTATSLQGASFLWLGSAAGPTSAITPLSSAEQTAMVNFVLAGGTAILFTDNNSFSGSAVAANASLISPFGISATGTLGGNQGHTVVDSANFVMGGPFGTIPSYTTAFPGWYSTVPATGRVLSRLNGNNNASAVLIEAGQLGAGSGHVIAFSDSGPYVSGGAVSGNFEGMYLNTLSNPVNGPTTISGTVTLGDYVGTAPGSRFVRLTFKIIDPGNNNVIQTSTVNVPTVNGVGNYSLNVTGISGAVKMAVDGPTWLQKTITTATGNTNVSFSLLNGEAVKSGGVIDLSDYTVVAIAFNALESDPNNGGNPSSNWNVRADLNRDGVVDLTDYVVVATNFNLTDQ